MFKLAGLKQDFSTGLFRFRAMIGLNPKIFSKRLALAVASGFALASFVDICFYFGGGSFLAGVTSTCNYLLLFGIGLLMCAGLVGTIALIAGRFLGTTVTASVASCLLLTMTVTSYTDSQPLSQFRERIWKTAPESVSFLEYRILKSFNDGTDYQFVTKTDSHAVDELCRSAQLSKVPNYPIGGTMSSISTRFPDIQFPKGTAFYQGDKIELAYLPSDQTAYIHWSPHTKPIAASQDDGTSDIALPVVPRR